MLLETIPVAVVNCDREGLIEYFNPQAVALWGRAPRLYDLGERFCGSLRIFRLDGQPLPHPEGPMGEALRTGNAMLNQECVIERPDGSRVVALANVVPYRDEGGEVTGAVSCLLDITERKRTEEQLRARDRELQQAHTYLAAGQRLNHTGSWAWNARTSENIFWSHETYRIFGLDPVAPCAGFLSRASYNDTLSRVHPEDQASFGEQTRRAIHERKDFQRDYRLLMPDGTVKYLHSVGRPVLDESGEVVEVVGTVQDITERKRAEELIKAQEQEIRAVVENSPDPIVRYDRELVRTYVNPAFVRAHGVPRDTLLRRMIGSSIIEGAVPAAPAEVENLQEAIQGVFATGRPVDIEVTWPLPERLAFYAVRLEPEFDAQGNVATVLCIARDITERKRAEESVRESQQLLQQVLAALPLGVVVLAPTGDVLFANAATRRIWGGDTIVDADQRWAQSAGYWHDTGKKIEATEWASVRALQNGRTSLNELVDIETFDGRQKIILNSAAPLHNPEGRITGAVVVIEDVTERKKHEEKLRQTETELARVARLTMMGELAATIAHEMNQPLAAVVTNASAALRWLATMAPNLDEARDAIRRIARDGERASEVIQRMRALIKKSGPSRTSLELNKLVQETLSLARAELARHKVTVETQLAVELPPVRADRVQVQQVLLNLIVNAIDAVSAAPTNPRVLRIRSAIVGPHEVEIAVEDTGIGLDAQDHERIFDPFYTTKPDGLGMGLPISRTIIEAHGGRLAIAPHCGPGTTMSFTLPILEGAKP